MGAADQMVTDKITWDRCYDTFNQIFHSFHAVARSQGNGQSIGKSDERIYHACAWRTGGRVGRAPAADTARRTTAYRLCRPQIPTGERRRHRDLHLKSAPGNWPMPATTYTSSTLPRDLLPGNERMEREGVHLWRVPLPASRTHEDPVPPILAHLPGHRLRAHVRQFPGRGAAGDRPLSACAGCLGPADRAGRGPCAHCHPPRLLVFLRQRPN